VTVKLVLAIHGNHLSHSVREKGLEPFVEAVLKKLAHDGKVAFRIRHGTKYWFLVDCNREQRLTELLGYRLYRKAITKTGYSRTINASTYQYEVC